MVFSPPPTQVSDDDSYVSDISDNVSEDNLSNDMENERQTLGKFSEVLMPCFENFVTACFGYFFLLLLDNLILWILRCKNLV